LVISQEILVWILTRDKHRQIPNRQLSNIQMKHIVRCIEANSDHRTLIYFGRNFMKFIGKFHEIDTKIKPNP